MNNILIHCAMEKEGKKLADSLGLKEKKVNNITKVFEGIKQNTVINLIITGIGKQKTAIGLTQYLCENNLPSILINIGYAGSTKTKIGTWINISKSYNLEWYIPKEEKYSMKDLGNKELIIIEELEKLPCYSAESFVTKTDIKDKVIFDMELHSVSLIADIYNIPLLSLKKVTDNLSIDDYYKSLNEERVFELESSIKYIQKYIV